MTATGALGESSLYARIVDDLRDSVLTNGELAEVAGVKTRQVQHWASGAHRPQGEAKDRLLELHYIVERLRDVYSPEGADIWIHGRNRSLGGKKPIDLLVAGEFEQVCSLRSSASLRGRCNAMDRSAALGVSRAGTTSMEGISSATCRRACAGR